MIQVCESAVLRRQLTRHVYFIARSTASGSRSRYICGDLVKRLPLNIASLSLLETSLLTLNLALEHFARIHLIIAPASHGLTKSHRFHTLWQFLFVRTEQADMYNFGFLKGVHIFVVNFCEVLIKVFTDGIYELTLYKLPYDKNLGSRLTGLVGTSLGSPVFEKNSRSCDRLWVIASSSFSTALSSGSRLWGEPSCGCS